MKKYSSIRVSFVRRPTSTRRTSKVTMSRSKTHVVFSLVFLYQVIPMNNQSSITRHIKQYTAYEQEQSSSTQNQQSYNRVSSNTLRSSCNLVKASQIVPETKTIGKCLVKLCVELHLNP